MELFAGFVEHTDTQVGRLVEGLEKRGLRENTLIFYIWGDNGSSAEGQNGTISELLAQNGIPTTISQHLKALDELGGLDALGGPKTDNMYHAGWAWAGSTPYRSTKLVAAHFGGTRQPMAVSWPKGIKADATPRPQFHHVIDIAPTIYDLLKITPPREVNGVPQDSIDGVSMTYTFADSKAKGQRLTQFFDIMASRGIYHDGWFASAFGPRFPWVPGMPKGIETWSPENDKWELYNLDEDWSQADDLAAKMPEKVEQMKSLFLIESTKNKNLPIGGGLWTGLHPEDGPATPYTEWKFSGAITRMPEFNAPKLGGKSSSRVTMEVDVPDKAEGVLYALGGFSGGLTCYVKDGVLCYEYNMFEIERTKLKARAKLPVGKVTIEVESKLAKPGAPMDVTMKVNGAVVAEGKVPITVPGWFTGNDCLDLGSDLGSPVSNDYFDQAPFAFNGTLGTTKIEHLKK
jgi:arylsulfatase